MWIPVAALKFLDATLFASIPLDRWLAGVCKISDKCTHSTHSGGTASQTPPTYRLGNSVDYIANYRNASLRGLREYIADFRNASLKGRRGVHRRLPQRIAQGTAGSTSRTTGTHRSGDSILLKILRVFKNSFCQVKEACCVRWFAYLRTNDVIWSQAYTITVCFVYEMASIHNLMSCNMQKKSETQLQTQIQLFS